MFGNRKDWLHQELANISKVLTQLVSDVSSMRADVNNANTTQQEHKGRLDGIDNRVGILERHESADNNKWSGVRIVWTVVGAFLVVLGTAATIAIAVVTIT